MIEYHIGGVRWRVHPLFGAMLLLLLSLDDKSVPLWCLLACALHEGGHLLVLHLFRQTPVAVTVGLWGLRIERRGGVTLNYRQSAAVALAGPAVNLLGALLCRRLLPVFAATQLAVGVLQLLPIEPLDGGQALQNLLCCFLPEDTVERVMLWVSAAVLFPLFLLGFYLLLISGRNFTLLALCLYLVSGIFFCHRR